MKTFLKYTIALSSILLLIIILKSCKKVDSSMNNTQGQVRERAIKAIRTKYGDVSGGLVYPINKEASELFYRNAAGQMVSLYPGGRSNKGAGVAVCTYTCNNTSNPADLVIIPTLDYIQRFYKCESSSTPGLKKSVISVSWTISVPFALTFMTSDNAPNTFGTVKFSPSGGSPTTLTASAGASDFTIAYRGAAPGCATNTLYQITYTFDDVPNSYMLSGATIEANLSLDNDCSLIGNVFATGLVSAPGITDELNLPCERIDKVWINPGTGPGGCATGAGNYVICNYPSGMTPVDYHQIEYRLVTSGSSYLWGDQSGSIYWAEPAGTGTPNPVLNPSTGVTNLVNMTSSSGTWLVRYRNVKTSVCDIVDPLPGGSPGGNWGNSALWFTEVWPL